MRNTETVSVTTRPHPISNTFHLVMVILTGGLWIPVWWFLARPVAAAVWLVYWTVRIIVMIVQAVIASRAARNG